jgi:quercetin dioxygenase-like cupin family protein
MGLALAKNDKAKRELADKGMEELTGGHVTGFVVPAGGGKHFNSPTPGRSFALKLLGRETGESVMMFEETLPAGTTSLHHLNHDSDEVAWVLAGQCSFMIGDEVTVGGPGTCAFMPRDIPHACMEEYRRRNRSCPVSFSAGSGRGRDRSDLREPPYGRGGTTQAVRTPSLGSS